MMRRQLDCFALVIDEKRCPAQRLDQLGGYVSQLPFTKDLETPMLHTVAFKISSSKIVLNLPSRL